MPIISIVIYKPHFNTPNWLRNGPTLSDYIISMTFLIALWGDDPPIVVLVTPLSTALNGSKRHGIESHGSDEFRVMSAYSSHHSTEQNPGEAVLALELVPCGFKTKGIYIYRNNFCQFWIGIVHVVRNVQTLFVSSFVPVFRQQTCLPKNMFRIGSSCFE